jgi:hypothetical protein
MFLHKKAPKHCFGRIFCILAPFPPFQVALGSYRLKLRDRTNVEHVLCFIMYLILNMIKSLDSASRASWIPLDSQEKRDDRKIPIYWRRLLQGETITASSRSRMP